MTNRNLFDAANALNDSGMKAQLRDKFLDWCQKNGRTPMNPEAIQDWWKMEAEQ